MGTSPSHTHTLSLYALSSPSSIPPSMGNLSSIQVVQLSDNELTGGVSERERTGGKTWRVE